MRLSELVEKYVAYTVLRPKSSHNYALVMKNFIASVGNKDIRKVTVEDAMGYRDAVLNRAKPITFNNYRQHLAVLFNFAVDNKWIKVSPFAKIKAVRVYKKPKKTVEIPLIQKVLLVLETEAGLERADDENSRFHPQWFWSIAVRLFFFTAMRLRQLVELKWRDLDFEHRHINLRAEGSKTYREWKIPMPAILVDELLELRERTIAARRTRDIYDRQVFCLPLFSRYRKQFVRDEMIEDNVHAFFKRMSKVAGQSISAHRLRHTTATIIVNEHKDLKNAQKLLGHTDIRTTLEYVEENLDNMRVLLDSLSIET